MQFPQHSGNLSVGITAASGYRAGHAGFTCIYAKRLEIRDVSSAIKSTGLDSSTLKAKTAGGVDLALVSRLRVDLYWHSLLRR